MNANREIGSVDLPPRLIERRIYLIRSKEVILDADLAELYDVETKHLLRAMKRNRDRFPADFMFQLSPQEFANLRYQIGTSSVWGGRRYSPYAFTEQGVAMLSSILRSARAVKVNIAIMRAFVRLREVLASHEELTRRVAVHDEQIIKLFELLDRLLQSPPEEERPLIGFQP